MASEDSVRCVLLTSPVLLAQVSGGRCLGSNPDPTYQLRGLKQASCLTGWGLGVGCGVEDGWVNAHRAPRWCPALVPVPVSQVWEEQASADGHRSNLASFPQLRVPGPRLLPKARPHALRLGRGLGGGGGRQMATGQSRTAPTSLSLSSCVTQARYCPPGPWGPSYPLPALPAHRGDGESLAAGLGRGQVARVAPPWQLGKSGTWLGGPIPAFLLCL